jgi:dual specificity phosphatase 12
MKDRGITHILSVCTNVIPPLSTEYPFAQARLSVEDADDANIIIALPTACQWIHHVINSGGVVLVHSYNGHSRAAAVVAAYCEIIRPVLILC